MKGRWVYFAYCKAVDAVKIGSSQDPEKRIQAMSGTLPERFNLVARARGGIREEYGLQAYLHEHHIFKEWFRYGQEVCAVIHDLQARGKILPQLRRACEAAFHGGKWRQINKRRYDQAAKSLSERRASGF